MFQRHGWFKNSSHSVNIEAKRRPMQQEYHLPCKRSSVCVKSLSGSVNHGRLHGSCGHGFSGQRLWMEHASMPFKRSSARIVGLPHLVILYHPRCGDQALLMGIQKQRVSSLGMRMELLVVRGGGVWEGWLRAQDQQAKQRNICKVSHVALWETGQNL